MFLFSYFLGKTFKIHNGEDGQEKKRHVEKNALKNELIHL